MSFHRTTTLEEPPNAETLSQNMAGIGLNFAAEPNPNAPIEETLVYASMLGMEEHDLRVLSVLTTWIGVHQERIHVDRLLRCLSGELSLRTCAYWSAIASWLAKDRRFARLKALDTGTAIDLLPVGTEFQIARRGEDPRFVGSVLRVPAGTLRERASDVLAPELLVQRHRGYRNRVRMGPTWRADVWTVLEANPQLRVVDVARQTGCSFATAWNIAQDFHLLAAEPMTFSS